VGPLRQRVGQGIGFLEVMRAASGAAAFVIASPCWAAMASISFRRRPTKRQQLDPPHDPLVYRFQRLFPTGDLFEDLARRGGPSEGFGVEVVVFKVSHNSVLQLGDAFEDPPSDAFAGDLGEEALSVSTLTPTVAESPIWESSDESGTLAVSSHWSAKIIQLATFMPPTGKLTALLTRIQQTVSRAPLGCRGSSLTRIRRSQALTTDLPKIQRIGLWASEGAYEQQLAGPTARVS